MRRPGKAALKGEILGFRGGDYVLATEDGSVEYVRKDEVGDLESPGTLMFGVGAATLLSLGSFQPKNVGPLLVQDLQLSTLGLVVFFRSAFLRGRNLSNVSLIELARLAAPPQERSGWVGGYLAMKEASGSYWGYEYKPSRWAYRATLGVLSVSENEKTSYGGVAGLGVAFGRRNRCVAESVVDNANRRDIRLGERGEAAYRQAQYTMSVSVGYERYVSRSVFIRAVLGPGYRFGGPQFFESGAAKWHVAVGFAAGMKL